VAIFKEVKIVLRGKHILHNLAKLTATDAKGVV
jgi:hypothetical protein